MADYAGACAAIKARLVANWTETPIALQNETPSVAGVAIDPWPPVNGAGKPVPWIYLEVIGNQASLRGAGKPGDHVWIYLADILIHVLVPEGYGIEEPQRLAVAAGEIFRAATFYNDGAGAKIVCGAPRTDGGASAADQGNWFRVTCNIPFEFFYRG